MDLQELSKLTHWFVEFETPTSWHVRGVRRIIYNGQSRYQRIAVVEFEDLGKTLLLDGKVQSSLYDEFIYHESLVHPAMVAHPSPEKVLVIGGGEGATVREVLRHSTVKEVTMVDIDEEVIRVSREYLPEMSLGAFSDPRLRLVIGDGREFVAKAREDYDVVIIDVTDPLEGGPSYLLYTVEFYSMVKDKLRPGGIMVTQATSTFYSLRTFATIYKTVAKVFPLARPYQAYVPSFDSSWGFVIGSLGPDPASMGIDEVRTRLGRVKGELRFYDEEVHQALFKLPKYIRRVLEDPGIEPATDSRPTFMPA